MKLRIRLKLNSDGILAICTAIEDTMAAQVTRQKMMTDCDIKQQVYLAAEIKHRLEVRLLSMNTTQQRTVGLSVPEAIAIVKLVRWGMLSGRGNYERSILQLTFNTLHQLTA
jgi:hypothetical protein